MDKRIGILGGGQLGRMLTEAANRLNVSVVTLDAGEACPSKQINAHSDHVNGSFNDPRAIHQLAAKCDILTTEIEHVNTDVLEGISNGTDVEVQPSWRTIQIIKDKYDQKLHLMSLDLAVAQFQSIKSSCFADVQEAAEVLGYPLMLKSRTEAYDGRGNFPIKDESEIASALATLKDRPLYAERWANFTAELAVMVVKTEDDACDSTGPWERATLPYPVTETVQEDSICKLVYAPARNVSSHVTRNAQDLARRAVAGFWGRGVFGVEMFLLQNGTLLINEIAPRPHNSGHYTIEGCLISQYEAHIRAILRLPITSTKMRNPHTFALMINILGGAQPQTHLRAVQKALSIKGAAIHMYGKGDARPGRKMGHVTVIASSMAEAEDLARPLIKLVDQIRAERRNLQPTVPSAPAPTLQGRLSEIQLSGSEKSFHNTAPLVAITMGSDSDRFVLEAGIEFLEELNVPYSATITSAHRTPDRMFAFAREAASKGVKVIIAAAGGAAHLPGMIAALTSLPVIGIPVKGSVLDGEDSLLSIVQMPRGCPVATVAINNSVNAAQLAVRILALEDVEIRRRLDQYLADQTASVIMKGERMERVGFKAYGLNE